MLRRIVLTCALTVVCVLTPTVGAWAQVAPESPDRELPASARRIARDSKQSYEFGRAWFGVADRAREIRAFRQTPVEIMSSSAAAATAVSGNFSIPVFLVRFANTDSVQFAPVELEDALFSTTLASLTLRAYYLEQSNNLLNVGGQVFGWQALPQIDTYYEGMSNGLTPGDARTGELILTTLTAFDNGVDFGVYDNDGPDGFPNSGDDDGYVDFVAFVHPEAGGECGGSGPNLWSHRWRFSSWPASSGLPYQTNDVSANGGSILIDDYVLQPGVRCGGTGRIEIGVFCHEFGHAFGLPDLYDINGGGPQGIGHWGLMASGNWNSPAQPAHMSAWTKQELGWVQTIPIQWDRTTVTIAPVASSRLVYEVYLPDDRWQRRSDCVLTGAASLAVGLSSTQSTARGWSAPKGYGNGWVETVARDFHSDGSAATFFDYDYAMDSEGGFDFGFVVVEVGGVETTLAVYDGTTSGHGSHDLSATLGPGAVDYRLKFRFRSDEAFSNEDGNFVATCSPFVVDNVQVVGGGTTYFADFEVHRQGWYQPANDVDNPASESWLIENRQASGFDANLHGSGLMLYHVDREILATRSGNSGGPTEVLARGLVVEEADGRGDLLKVAASNRGDAGDPWPGSTGASAFDIATNPAARTNGGSPTRFALTTPTALGDSMRVTFVGGASPPAMVSLSPDSATVDSTWLRVDAVGGAFLRPGIGLRLVAAGRPDVISVVTYWDDFDRVGFQVDLSSALPGVYDVVVENPDGQTAVVAGGLRLTSSVTATDDGLSRPTVLRLGQNYPNPFNPRTTIRYDVPAPAVVRLRVFDLHGRAVRTLVDETQGSGFYSIVWDGTDSGGRAVASGVYLYRLEAGSLTQHQKMLLVR